MSDSQAYEEITASSDGVSVIKRFEEDEFPVPAIAFEFESDRDESIVVQMSDTVPEGIEVEDLGFHPEYGSEYWTIDDETITFEKELQAGGTYTTVYGIRATGSDDVEQFLTEPVIEDVDPPLSENEMPDDVIPETDDDVVKDAIAGDGEIPGLEEEDDDEDDDTEDLTLELNDPNEPGEPTETDESAETSTVTESEDTSSTTSGPDISLDESNLVSQLANEIRQENVSGQDIKLLRRALGVSASGGGNESANQARLEQLQRDISDLRAYTSALEEFLGENGTGEELIEEFEDELASFDERLESVQSELETNSEEVDSVSDTVSDVDDELDTLSDDVAEMGDELDTVKDDIDAVSGDIGSLETTVEELEENVSDDDLTEQIEEIEEDISDLQTWQEQIKKTFGG